MSKTEDCVTLIKRILQGPTGHLREEKLVQAIKERFWWKEMQRDVRIMLEEYKICGQVVKKAISRTQTY